MILRRILPRRTSCREARLRLLSTIFALAICWAAAPLDAAQRSSPAPDVTILVVSGTLPLDGVSFTYNGTASDAVARADLATLLRQTGWAVSQVKISTAGEPKLTSVEFQADGVVDWGAGELLVEPIIFTFKRYDVISINYLLQGTFPFRSLKDFSNTYVDIDWDQRNNSYTYTIRVKDRSFEQLGLPPLVTDPPQEAKKENVDEPGRGGGRKIWMAVLVALAAGAVVFVISSRMRTKGAVESKDGSQGAGKTSG